jgi:general secretion pathway protein G
MYLRRTRAFTLIEVIVVLAIISLLAALLFPAFLTARGKARQVVCASNLRQSGLGIAMYAQDYDGLYPHAVDPSDRAAPGGWGLFPEFAEAIPSIGLVQEVLQPYLSSRQVFACPADKGIGVHEFSGVLLNAFPTSYGKFGTSYYYRTEIAARRASEASIQTPTSLNVLFDGAGRWHGTLLPLTNRYNVLFADGHVKNVNWEQIDEAWRTPL